MSLSKKVEKHLKKQAKLDEISEEIINLFFKEHLKEEVYDLLGYLDSSGSPQHSEEIKKFIANYEGKALNVKDIKTYLNIFKANKQAMKENAKNPNNSKSKIAEENNGQ